MGDLGEKVSEDPEWNGQRAVCRERKESFCGTLSYYTELFLQTDDY